MKKALILSAFMLCACDSAFAAFGTQPDYKVKLWKSSATCAATGQVNWSSGPIIIHQVNVSSPTLNQSGASFLMIMTSTSNYVENNVSTKAVISTNINGTGIPSGWYIPFDIFSGSYTFLNKQGIACTEILYDWQDAMFANPSP